LIVDSSCTQQNGEWFCERPSPLRIAAVWAACRLAVGLQLVRGNRHDDGFGILMYHRVAETVPGVGTPTMNVAPRQLRRQLTGLLERGFVCWPLRQLIKAHRERRAVPSSAFAITFDDGFENNYLDAWPILRELNLPATIFVATKYLDTDRPFPFDDWPAAGSDRVPPSAWRPLSVRQCEEMLEGGLIEIGAHTHSHENFLGRGNEFRRDMTLCLEVLRDRFGIERPAFAFPYGYKSPELVEAAKRLGVACSLSTRARRVSPGDDEYEWGRLWAEENDTPTMLAAKMDWFSSIADVGESILAGLERVTSSKASRQLRGTAQGDLPRTRKEMVLP
jgi:peptidoglycan/xylan/chitin deacetylase (PgdA/CDA1 family)